MELFGFTINRNKSQNDEAVNRSVIPPTEEDGAIEVSSSLASYYGFYLDIDGVAKDEIQAIQKYREIAQHIEVDEAIQDIVNEAIPHEDETPLVSVNADKLDDFSEDFKKVITDEFSEILKLLKFSEKASDIFRKWYVDGRLYYHIITDPKNQKNGIIELRPIEATKIKKVVELKKDKLPNGVEIVKSINEYFVYSENGFSTTPTSKTQVTPAVTMAGVKLTKESVIYVPSGVLDQNTGNVISYLHKSIRPANQLRMLEDAVVIYRWSRAPERRIFYIDVGNLPKTKAEQYVKDIMNRYRNKISYDAKTGEVRDDKKFMSMMEDFWMPRREGGKGTEITTLPGGAQLGELSDVEYFQKKLYQSMNVPVSRMLPDTGFNIGRPTEITRDEVKFQKFINKLRRKFSELFFDLMKSQLLLKNYITEDDWEEIKEKIVFTFQVDNFFSELKEQDVLQSRINIALEMDPLLGKYFSVEWVCRNVFKMDDDEIEKIKEQAAEEYASSPWWFAQKQVYDQQLMMMNQNQQNIKPE